MNDLDPTSKGCTVGLQLFFSPGRKEFKRENLCFVTFEPVGIRLLRREFR